MKHGIVVGSYVRLHPCTAAWSRGAEVAVVLKIGKDAVQLRDVIDRGVWEMDVRELGINIILESKEWPTPTESRARVGRDRGEKQVLAILEDILELADCNMHLSCLESRERQLQGELTQIAQMRRDLLQIVANKKEVLGGLSIRATNALELVLGDEYRSVLGLRTAGESHGAQHQA